ncbi:conserved membrane hypothetical protein [Magnetospirillum sp. LM-5]|uniref:hypothetical protein n=1 Tax=Magnetospirillum sp. LM-5 TaxID=2681466 RepID=UPI00137FF129|nr:hypothetical protein [Magnetospirillum sp. LM-5]CAA7616454.1 conserved membrane hypothetical protein [Magnetospirillum sp. LM-5]
MITADEIARGITGAWLLAKRNPAGIEWFDDSDDGFLKSFWAAVLVAPAFLGLDLLAGEFADAGPRQLAVKLIAYVIDWTAFPLVMFYIAATLGRGGQWARYVVAYNWSAVVQVGILFPVAVLATLAPMAATALLAQALTILMLIYRAFVAHVALKVNLGTAAGIVLLDVLLAGLLKNVAERIAGG